MGLERCNAKEVGRDLYCIVAVDLSRIPSPFADLTGRADRPLHFLNNHAHPGVKVLFYRTCDYLYRSRRDDLIVENHGTFTALQHGSTAELPFAPVRVSGSSFSHDEEGTIQIVPLGMQIRRHATTGERGYFIVNEDCDICIVNDRYVGKRLAAGPLPDFVVAVTDHWTMFWWRTRAAVGYVPGAVYVPRAVSKVI